MELTKEEKLNLYSFSSQTAVHTAFNKYGLWETEIMIVKKYFKKGGKILDIGCGSGRTTDPLNRMGFNVIGIDISEDMIKFAQKKFPNIDFIVQDACNLEFVRNSFDYVLFSFNGLDCIYPEEKRIKALREIHRVLKNNGIFVFSSHNSRSFLPPNLLYLPYFIKKRIENNLRSILHNYSRKYVISKHIYGYLILYQINPKEQARQLDRIGFKLIEELGMRFRNNLKYHEPWLYYVAKK